ncbi:hypothetical protein ACN4EG_17700 [Alkalinema pantanalense CENA528]|uniref:hypothetical protein n=1 Tax=Alkalinema pantanalense TaxID=1620705 RepID=UPI003D6F3ED5
MKDQTRNSLDANSADTTVANTHPANTYSAETNPAETNPAKMNPDPTSSLMPSLEWPRASQNVQIAKRMPESTDLLMLLAEIDPVLTQFSQFQQLKLAGDLLLELAELYESRAQALMGKWEDAYRDPIVEDDFFADLVRQTMALDLTDLVEPPPPRLRKSKAKPADTIVAPVDKSTLLELLDEWQTQSLTANCEDDLGLLSSSLNPYPTENPNPEITNKEQALQLAHDENVSDWTQAIAASLITHNAAIRLLDLPLMLNLPWIEVWLGALLGNFQLEQRGEFYSPEVWVTQAIMETEIRKPEIEVSPADLEH